MAQNIITEIVDDFDGTTPAETVTFTHEGSTYTVDLSAFNKKNLTSMMEAHERKMAEMTQAYNEKMARYLDKAVLVSARKSSRSYDPVKVRAWAKENGLTVPDRGRLSGEILDAYKNRKKKSGNVQDSETN